MAELTALLRVFIAAKTLVNAQDVEKRQAAYERLVEAVEAVGSGDAPIDS